MKSNSLANEFDQYVERDRKCFAAVPKRFPTFVVVEGHGTVLKDIQGKEYLDFCTPSNIVGHSHPRIVRAIQNQVEKLTQFGHAIAEPRLKLAEYLKNIAPYGLRNGKVVLGCSGTDSMEFAVKMAKCATKRPVIMSYIGGHHGRSPGVTSFTSDYAGSKIYAQPSVVETVYVPYPHCYRCVLGQTYPDCSLACLDYIRHVLDQVIPPEAVAAILTEPLLSWSGFVRPPAEYFPRLKKMCEEYGILYVDDEVFTGFGRTGKMFATEHFGVEPDIMCMGKAMGAGTPLSAILAKSEMIDTWETGHFYTSSAAESLLTCVSSLTAIEIIRDESLHENARKLGEYLLAGLRNTIGDEKSVGDIRGMGLLLGIEIVKNRDTKEPDAEKAHRILNKTFEKGVLLNQTSGAYDQVVRIVSPLTASREQVDRLIVAVAESFKETRGDIVTPSKWASHSARPGRV